jgi:peroxiredoxin
VLAVAAPAVRADAPLAVGARAPDFSLPDQHGGTLTLSGVLARRGFAVVAFYVKAFTGG